jgi:membrane-bound lytic murein transglycosylase A
MRSTAVGISTDVKALQDRIDGPDARMIFLTLSDGRRDAIPSSPAAARLLRGKCRPFLHPPQRWKFQASSPRSTSRRSRSRSEPDDEYRFPFYRRPGRSGRSRRSQSSRRARRFLRFRPSAGWPQGIGLSRSPADRSRFPRRPGLEIAWAKSKVDVFFVHVQGAARCDISDGRIGRITYAAKAGHPLLGSRQAADRPRRDRSRRVFRCRPSAWLAMQSRSGR